MKLINRPNIEECKKALKELGLTAKQIKSILMLEDKETELPTEQEYELMVKTGFTIQKLRKGLKRLEELGFITRPNG